MDSRETHSRVSTTPRRPFTTFSDHIFTNGRALDHSHNRNRKLSRESNNSSSSQWSPFRQMSSSSSASSCNSYDNAGSNNNNFEPSQNPGHSYNSMYHKVADNMESHVARLSLKTLVSCLQNRSSHLGECGRRLKII